MGEAPLPAVGQQGDQFMRLRSLLLASALALVVGIPLAEAKTFKWAGDGDVNSMDPYARQETFLLTFDGNMYEPLVRRDAKLNLEAALATQWKQVAPTTWRFTLRPGVKWQDGTPFTADDVVFSYERARGPGSNIGADFISVKEIKKIDDLTVEFETKVVDPIFVDQLTGWGIMSKAWATAHNAVHSADLTKNEENFATRNAMGTGPYMLKSRDPDVRTVLVSNPNWWDKPKGNVTDATFNHIADDSTRVAALLSGQVDYIYAVPLQDVASIRKAANMKIAETAELRTIYLGFDMARAELLESNVKGKNPFQDKRVRQAFYQAIDIQGIKKNIMEGQSHPTGLMVGPGVGGYDPKLDTRLPYDVAAAKKLLADAGYPQGFSVGLDCPTDRYAKDGSICEVADPPSSGRAHRQSLIGILRSKSGRRFATSSLPTFLIGILLIYPRWCPFDRLFSVLLGWLPSFGRGDVVRIGWWSTGLLTVSASRR
jgi:peptide/nickel transport system substrate-binding protein